MGSPTVWERTELRWAPRGYELQIPFDFTQRAAFLFSEQMQRTLEAAEIEHLLTSELDRGDDDKLTVLTLVLERIPHWGGVEKASIDRAASRAQETADRVEAEEAEAIDRVLAELRAR